MILQRVRLVREVYLRDQRPWVLAYSGGKDSTAVLQLVWMALKSVGRDQTKKQVYVAYVDTGMEHPAFSSQVDTMLAKIQLTATAELMPISTIRLEPDLRYRFFVGVIGRGYAPPTHWFRWCTSKMRIKPMSDFIRSRVAEFGEVVVILGLRKAESQARNATLGKYATPERFVGRYGSLRGALAFTPIEDFRTEDIWQFLMQSRCPWAEDNRALAQIYSLASGGECPSYSVGEGMAPSCGGSRFGCWTCTVVRKDKAGMALSHDNEAYEQLHDFRNWLARIRYEKRRRWKYRRNGSPGPGPLRLSTRKEILRRLAELASSTGLKLLRDDELCEIQRLWVLDGDRGNSAFAIYDPGSTSVREPRNRIKQEACCQLVKIQQAS